MLKPEVSIPVALATGTVVYSIYSAALPPMVDVRASTENNDDAAAAERTAAWTSAGVVAGISLISRDVNPFIVGSAMIIALSWWYRHANMVVPELGKAVPRMFGEPELAEPDGTADQAGDQYGGYEAA